MVKYAAPVEVVNAALSRLGKRPLQDLSGASKPAMVASDIYEGIVGDLLTRHTWSFATKRELLVHKRSTTGEYTEVYAVPSDSINLIRVSSGGVLIDYELQGEEILTNVKTDLVAKYHFRAIEGSWPADFAEAVVRMLQAHFARALDEDESAAERLEQNAEARFTRAMVRDRRQSPPKSEQRVNGGRLATAWRGGY